MVKSMRLRFSSRNQTALTRTELLIVAACVLVLVALAMALLPRDRARRQLIACQNQLKQVGLAFKVFPTDSDDRFPFTTPGSLGYKNETSAWQHFQSLSNGLGSAKLPVCPADSDRLRNRAGNFEMGTAMNSLSLAHQGNRAVSYFVGVDAAETLPNMLLSGDRNLVSSNMTGPMLALTATASSSWSADLHGRIGSAVLADGSVQLLNLQELQRHMALNPLSPTNRLLLPLVP